jgi:outer membrane protein assembly factor BamA
MRSTKINFNKLFLSLFLAFVFLVHSSQAKLGWFDKEKSVQQQAGAAQPQNPLEQINKATGSEAQLKGKATENTLLGDDISEEDISNPSESIGNFDRAITVKQIQVVGNQLVPTDVILSNMRTKKGSKFSRRKVAYDLQSLNNLGYFDKDKLLAVPVPEGNEGVVLRIQVVENRPITGLIIKGNELVEKSDMEEYLTPLIGMPRSSTQIRSAVEKIEKLYHDKGYLLAAVTELHFDPDGFLTVSIDEGKIAAIEFEGNTRTQNSYLQRVIPDTIKEGQAYNEEKVIKFMEGLQRTGFFKDIKREIKPSPDDPNKHIVTFKLEEQRTKALNVGTGIGNLNGIFANASFTEPNFRGQGESISFSGQAGTGILTALDGDTGGRFARKGNYAFNAAYTDPFVGNSKVSMSWTGSGQQFGSWIVDSSIQRTVRGGVSLAMPLDWGGKNQWSFQNGLSLSDNDVQNFGSNARNQLITALQKEGKSLAQATSEANSIRRTQLVDGIYADLTPSLVYRNFDDTGSGWRSTFFGGPSIGFGGAGSYGSLGVDLRRYQRLAENGLMFKNAFHAEGLIGDVADFRNLKMGGPYGMRGYRQFRDIGIGTSMLSNTAELSIPINLPKNPIKDTKLVLFNDIGLVGGQDRLNKLYDRKIFAAGVGAGIEFNIPLMGPLRVDYAIPLLRNDNKSFWSGRIHINAGSQL